jgi:hypothetical protein
MRAQGVPGLDARFRIVAAPAAGLLTAPFDVGHSEAEDRRAPWPGGQVALAGPPGFGPVAVRASMTLLNGSKELLYVATQAHA